MDKVTECCEICKLYKKAPARPVVSLPLENEFNEVVAVHLKEWKHHDRGRGDPKPLKAGAIIGQRAMECWLVALLFSRGSQPVLLKKNYIFFNFPGGSKPLSTLSNPSGSAYEHNVYFLHMIDLAT